MRLHFVRSPDKNLDPDSKSTTMPRRGLFTIDQIKHYSRLSADEMQVIGVDPGMIDLVHCVDPERIHSLHPPDSPPATVVYTARRRKHETCSVLYQKKMKEEKDQEVLEAESAMSQHCKRSTHRDTLCGYFDARRGALDAFQSFYGDLKYRIRRWRTYKKEQKSIQMLIDRIGSMQTKDTMVLAYGSGVNAIANLNSKGIAPCINMGLRRRLSRHFLVVDTPEHYTSKICSACHECCGPFSELDAKRRVELLAKATTEEERKKASRFEIRGLRRCQNVECGVIHCRDRNGALNIATNFWRGYRNEKMLRGHSAEELKLIKAHQKLA